ncbi:TonB-dependent receptor [Flavobacterium sp.]
MSVFTCCKKLVFSIFLYTSLIGVFAQQQKPISDSASVLTEVVVHGYLSVRKISKVPASVGVLTSAQIKLHPNNSLVAAVNTLPGVRMEERTPGSYRLSLRGSTFRSPFGVRNVKVYLGEIPLTDAGGNTYLNALDISGLRSIEVMKGPDGSLFGANSGGVVLLDAMDRNRAGNSGEVRFDGGSYGLFHQSARIHQNIGKNELDIFQAYQGYDGYREHSNMFRRYIQLADRQRYGTKNKLEFSGFYSNIEYQTPGGLTLQQFRDNPRSARPSTGTSPGAVEQQIGIRSEILFGGLVNELHFSDAWRNKTTIFGSSVDFENPFLTNYEKRNEKTYGARSYFEYTATNKPTFKSALIFGGEWQRTDSDINNYENLAGNTGNPQAFDELATTQHFIFARYALTLAGKLDVEAGISLNHYRYKFRNLFPINEQQQNTKDFKPQLMPRLAASYSLNKNFIWRATISRGYSTPTIAEVRSSNNLVNTDLQPETGWNFETGFRWFDMRNRFKIDASVFYYRLDNSIVNRRLPNDTDFFVNAGGTNQLGLEVDFNAVILKQDKRFLREFRMSQAVTVNRFRFRDYTVNGNDFSGNDLTGTPAYVFVSGLQLSFPERVYLYVQCNFTGKLPLNDGNTAYASAYELVQAKIGWDFSLSKTEIGIHAGMDNILNQRYSLGNDLNAFGNRFYNPAPGRNVYLGLNIEL